jgi:alkyl sulfatase BDS1-like metallo-beta-lactamase superfamily hydrolase
LSRRRSGKGTKKIIPPLPLYYHGRDIIYLEVNWMADLFALAEKIINDNDMDFRPFSRINHELSELDDGLSFVEAFSNSVNFATDDGLVIFDTSSIAGGSLVVKAINQWRPDDRFNALIYTHGHVDHVGGSGAFIDHAKQSGAPLPEVLGHDNVEPRFDRYDLTNGYNQVINHRQFGLDPRGSFLPESVARPTTTYSDFLVLNRGGLDIELYHAKGETDDHTWAWIPAYKAVCAGDFFIWNFPNAGNPQKVQRFPLEWAAAMRAMAAKNPELLLPAHGLPIKGRQLVNQILTDIADALEGLVGDTLELMNAGAKRNDVIHTVKVKDGCLDKPYLQPLYDEPEFTINNIWRLYGGWYDGNPANLKPARESALAAEFVTLAGGPAKMAARAGQLAAEGDLRLACHLIETAVLADPENKNLHEIRAGIYQQRVKQETSLMAKGIFRHAAAESEANR